MAVAVEMVFLMFDPASADNARTAAPARPPRRGTARLPPRTPRRRVSSCRNRAPAAPPRRRGDHPRRDHNDRPTPPAESPRRPRIRRARRRTRAPGATRDVAPGLRLGQRAGADRDYRPAQTSHAPSDTTTPVTKPATPGQARNRSRRRRLPRTPPSPPRRTAWRTVDPLRFFGPRPRRASAPRNRMRNTGTLDNAAGLVPVHPWMKGAGPWLRNNPR